MGCRRGPAQQELTERKGNGAQARREWGGEECSDLFSLVLPLPASGQTKPEARGKGSQGDAAQKYLGIQNDLEG